MLAAALLLPSQPINDVCISVILTLDFPPPIFKDEHVFRHANMTDFKQSFTPSGAFSSTNDIPAHLSICRTN